MRLLLYFDGELYSNRSRWIILQDCNTVSVCLICAHLLNYRGTNLINVMKSEGAKHVQSRSIHRLFQVQSKYIQEPSCCQH